MNDKISNLNIADITPLPAPSALKKSLPIDASIENHIAQSRAVIKNVIHEKDPRFLLIVGPCSIHDTKMAIEYAHKLHAVAEAVADSMVVVMRVYFEKPRTSIGWRGMIFDPYLNGSYEIGAGLHAARKLLLEITALNIITATEVLDPIVPQYIDDLICWASIGARTTESQTHRELASGLSMPVGFKNGTDGTIDGAVKAMVASHNHRKFIGINERGKTSVVSTTGNKNTHLILRGGRSGTNYHPQDIDHAIKHLQEHDLPPAVMVDCSHGNSQKNHLKQITVFESVIEQYIARKKNIIGCMLESNLLPGKQIIQGYSGKLRYGISITDACLGWDDTKRLIESAHSLLQKKLRN